MVNHMPEKVISLLQVTMGLANYLSVHQNLAIQNNYYGKEHFIRKLRRYNSQLKE